ncbi:MAG: shikimate dehydrogenase [Candidatus Nanopelagicales bacterium]
MSADQHPGGTSGEQVGAPSPEAASQLRRAAVLGRPIAHSLSPVLHRAAYRQMGLPWSYEAIEVDEAGLAGFLDSRDESWVGLSLTMPLKRVVLPLLDGASDLVRVVGAANTVLLGPGGRVGHNTDVAGITLALAAIGAPSEGDLSAVILGAGATAASAVAALGKMGCREVEVRARRPEAVGELAGVAAAMGIGLRARPWSTRLPGREEAAILVCTVPSAGSAGLLEGIPADPGWLLDVSYAPWPPPLVTGWRAAGGPAVAGDEMLLHQAVEQVRLMCGRRPDVEVMRSALRAELAARAG